MVKIMIFTVCLFFQSGLLLAGEISGPTEANAQVLWNKILGINQEIVALQWKTDLAISQLRPADNTYFQWTYMKMNREDHLFVKEPSFAERQARVQVNAPTTPGDDPLIFVRQIYALREARSTLFEEFLNRYPDQKISLLQLKRVSLKADRTLAIGQKMVVARTLAEPFPFAEKSYFAELNHRNSKFFVPSPSDAEGLYRGQMRVNEMVSHDRRSWESALNQKIKEVEEEISKIDQVLGNAPLTTQCSELLANLELPREPL